MRFRGNFANEFSRFSAIIPILQQVQDEWMGRLRLCYRHSRVSGNPERCCIRMALSAGNRGIPAYAGMTVGGAEMDGR